MKRLLAAAVLALVPASAFAETIVVPSAGSVPETVERLRTSVEQAGARIFTIVDFGGGAKSIGQDVGEIQLVIFGDPRIGAAVLSIDPMAALDLPGKVLVYDTGNGSAMAYEVPADTLAARDIPENAPILRVIDGTLDRITSTAAQ